MPGLGGGGCYLAIGAPRRMQLSKHACPCVTPRSQTVQPTQVRGVVHKLRVMPGAAGKALFRQQVRGCVYWCAPKMQSRHRMRLCRALLARRSSGSR